MHDILKIAHLIVMAMVAGISVSHYALLRVAGGGTEEARRAVETVGRAFGNMTSVAIILVWATGLPLLWSGEDGRAYDVGGWFYAKIGFVLLLTAGHIYLRVGPMRRAGDMSSADAERALSVVWLSALLAISLAVVSFGS